ncbi:helix-turn-helix domain-containing protein [Pontiella agarivorans]|uniref:Helix-turn-helix transcriptional regulator n=1 Tax=Pontiella agarivorans TaxID=3038953 RepID=A0ABU5MZL4_9BACT|nr:helix-turn-helix transcriptional regulator [Pontiella agarivorans]MDZ8119650.1 helix-turn-helix transcriptional regulator [Pontiella agarivorans]
MEQASLNIGTIGQRLEAARQAKGVTVSEAGQATKILSKFIEAMEHDDFGALSAPVYAKSFIRMYAQYLGMDAAPLVDEYIAQHAPKTKLKLTEEARHNLAKADRVPGDAGNAPEAVAAPRSGGGARAVFGEVNDAITNLSGSGIPLKLIGAVLGGLILIGIIVLSVSQCSDEEATEPRAAGGAASVEHPLITDGVPDAFLAQPGVVETDTK